MDEKILPREMALRAQSADRVVVLKSGVVRLERGKFAEIFVPYEWHAALRQTHPTPEVPGGSEEEMK